MSYSDKEIQFLRENFPKFGASYCKNFINKKPTTIRNYCVKYLNLSTKNVQKHNSLRPINPEQFLDISTKEVSYFLGLLWSDGNLINYISSGAEHFRIGLEIASDDAKDILPILNSLGKWAIRTRKREKTWKETSIITTNNKPLFTFLQDNDFLEKSIKSPTKILRLIPEKLRIFFWRGVFDGDGCISFGKKHKSIKFSGSFNQDWTEFVNLFESLEIKPSIYKESRINKKGILNQSSDIVIQNKAGIKEFCLFLLKSGIGFSRKTNKIKEFISLYP